MTTQPFVFRVERWDKVLDGDTYDLVLDVGFRLHATVRVRLLGWDTPERRKGSAFERAEAIRATDVARQWWTRPGGTVWVRTEKDTDSFGRWLGDVWRELHGSEDSLGEALEREALATPWPTRWRDAHDPSLYRGPAPVTPPPRRRGEVTKA